MAFKNGAVPVDWKTVVNVPLYMLLMNRICRVTGSVVDDEQGVSEQGENVLAISSF